MKLRNPSLLFFLISTMVSFAQPANWIYNTEKYNFFDRITALGGIEAGENSIVFVENNRIFEMSYYGELITELVFELDSEVILSQLAGINEIFKRNVNGQDIYIVSIIGPGRRIYLNTYSLNGQQLGVTFELEERANSIDTELTVTVVEANNNDLIVFTKTAIATYTLQDDLTWIRSTLTHDFQEITDAFKVGDNYFIATNDGKGVLLNADFEVIWENNTTHRLEAAVKTNNGFLLCGTDIDNEVAYITQLNDVGDQLWQQSLDGRSAHKVALYDDDYLVGGVDLYSIDTSGELLWNKELPSKSGVYHISIDAYDGVMLQTKDANLRVNINSQVPFEKHNSLSTNNIETHISPVGNLDFDYGAIQYPIGESTSPIFTNAPIFVGQKENGEFKGFYEPYTEGAEFIGLPQNIIAFDNTLWKITQKEIDLIQDKLQAGEPLEPYSQSMLTYPGKGNPHLVVHGEAISIDNDFAPFVDVNNDGIYNMFDGDYPEMKGDQMIWWAIKDPISEMEIHGCWYAYQCGDHIVSNTVYVDYEVFNTSTDDLFNCRFGKFVDWDLGCYTDDMVGSLPSANSIFVYNADAIDGTNDAECIAGIQTYEDHIPIQSMTLLNEEMASSMYFNGISFPPQEPATTDPNTLEEVNHFLHARFRDETPLTVGGTGYNPGSVDIVQHVFPGNPSNPDEWSMYQENLSVGDRRSVVASPDFDLPSGTSKSFSFAFTTHPDIPHPAPDVSEIEQNLLELDAIFDDGNPFFILNLGQDVTIESGENLNLDAGGGGQSYLWSTGETSASISIENPGNYSVTVMDDTGCERTDDININLATTAVSNINTVEQLNMYPNPIGKGQEMTIQLAEMSQLATLKVFNLLGQQVYNQVINAFVNTVELKTDKSLDSGIYLVQLSFENGQLMIGKLLVE